MSTVPADISCSIKQLPDEQVVPAAQMAMEINPANRPSPGKLIQVAQALVADITTSQWVNILQPQMVPTPDHLAVMTRKYWGAAGVKLTVAFMDNAPADLQARIIQHMNAWGQYCNAKFVLSNTDPQVRIARAADGYWSYLGTDILSIPKNQPTMNLQGFTMQTQEREFVRVVRHETGHTLGFPHEHMRSQFVARLNRAKTIAYFQQTQGWSQQVTEQQVLTPLSEASIRIPGIPNTESDQDSIMCYQLPGSITNDGQPIHGGNDIDLIDQKYAAAIYPSSNPPPPPPPPPSGGELQFTIGVKGSAVRVVSVAPPTSANGVSNMFAKLLALLAAFKAGDWATVFKLIGEIFGGIQSGQITTAEIAEAESMFTQAAQAAGKVN